jgi:hypothetical protein
VILGFFIVEKQVNVNEEWGNISGKSGERVNAIFAKERNY